MAAQYRVVSIDEPIRDARLLIVFIHGITGGPFTTWGGLRDDVEPHLKPSSDVGPIPERATEDCMGERFWPRWVKRELPDIDVWTVGYPAPLLKREDPFAYQESLINASLLCLQQLLGTGIAAADRRGVVFIAHSLGGLVVKSMLDFCAQAGSDREKKLLKATRGVAFLGTPHAGSGLATLMGNLPELLRGVAGATKAATWLLGKPFLGKAIAEASGAAAYVAEPSNAVQWLQRAVPEIRHLSRSYRDLVHTHGFSTLAFYETHPLIPKAENWFLRGFISLLTKPKNLLWIVDASNADPGVVGCVPEPVPYCDHHSLCKPESADSTMYRRLVNWLAERAVIRGTDIPVLDQAMEAALRKIIEDDRKLEKTMEKTINEWPRDKRNLHDIENRDHRVAVSHGFIHYAKEHMNESIDVDLRDSARLRADLEDSQWDFDRIVLYLWRKRELKDQFRMYLELLQGRTSFLRKEVEADRSPSLILTFRLVDSLREACNEGLDPLMREFGKTSTWIETMEGGGIKIDGEHRTRNLLKDGHKALQSASEWPEPQIKKPPTNGGSVPTS
jgi:hypothetical protein